MTHHVYSKTIAAGATAAAADTICADITTAAAVAACVA